MNFLFVCSANKDRSKTAEDYFSELYPNINFDSAGTNKKICNQLGTNYLEHHQFDWADKVFVMEMKHLKAIKANYRDINFSKIVVLNIKDIYTFGSKELIEVLKEKISI
jgi:predicted protein tyrosine phosphatase